MTWRGLVVAVLLAAVGAAAGVGVATWTAEEPATLAGTAPVSAADPAVPTDPPVDVLPDPSTPPLDPEVRTHTETIGQEPFDLELPVPNGWSRSNSRPGVWTWIVTDNPENTYLLRVSLPSGYSTIGAALDDRVAALEGATGIQEFTLEDKTADTFVATYVLDGHRRLTMERFLSLDGTQTVYAQVALIGREVDRDGMAALLDKISAEATR
jgi:hypothetical protein